MVKILEALDSVEPATIARLHGEQRVGATASVRDWTGDPRAAPPEPVPGSGELHSVSAVAQAIADD
jgi:hypothetical protein